MLNLLIGVWGGADLLLPPHLSTSRKELMQEDPAPPVNPSEGDDMSLEDFLQTDRIDEARVQKVVIPYDKRNDPSVDLLFSKFPEKIAILDFANTKKIPDDFQVSKNIRHLVILAPDVTHIGVKFLAGCTQA